MDVLELPRPVINFLRTMSKEMHRYSLCWDIYGGSESVTLTLTWKINCDLTDDELVETSKQKHQQQIKNLINSDLLNGNSNSKSELNDANETSKTSSSSKLLANKTSASTSNASSNKNTKQLQHAKLDNLVPSLNNKSKNSSSSNNNSYANEPNYSTISSKFNLGKQFSFLSNNSTSNNKNSNYEFQSSRDNNNSTKFRHVRNLSAESQCLNNRNSDDDYEMSGTKNVPPQQHRSRRMENNKNKSAQTNDFVNAESQHKYNLNSSFNYGGNTTSDLYDNFKTINNNNAQQKTKISRGKSLESHDYNQNNLSDNTCNNKRCNCNSNYCTDFYADNNNNNNNQQQQLYNTFYNQQQYQQQFQQQQQQNLQFNKHANTCKLNSVQQKQCNNNNEINDAQNKLKTSY